MKDFVSYDIAVKLKEKGFSEKCLYHYFDNKLVSNTCKSDNDNITTEDLLMSCNYLVSQFDTPGSNVVVSDAPTISQVLKWLREEKGLHIEIRFDNRGFGACIDKYDIHTLEHISFNPLLYYGFQKSYEEAVIEGIEYILNNLI